MQLETTESDSEFSTITLTVQVRRAQQRDHTAFDILAKHYRPLLFSIAFLRTADINEAEDLVQESLIQAWNHLPTLKEPVSFPAWLRTIIVRACNVWFRRRRHANTTCRLDEVFLLSDDRTVTPLAHLLSREQQRELHQALITLPEANRLALLLHVWSGYSYREIAVFTGVQPSTVEGRIYRAKRQLRDRLRDAGASFFHDAGRAWNQDAVVIHKPLREENNMTATLPPTTQTDTLDLPLNFVLFNERFSRLIDCGMSLVRSLKVLEDMPLPYGPVIADIRQHIEAGETLSGTMKHYPALFSTFYIGLIRTGEIGGILEESLQRGRRVTTREWKLDRRRPTGEKPLYLTLPSDLPLPDDWSELTEYQRLATLIEFFTALSLMLAAGVPILIAMRTATDLLPITQQAGMAKACEAVAAAVPFHQALELVGIFPAFMLAFAEVGFTSGSLDSTLYLAAETVEQELNCRFPDLP